MKHEIRLVAVDMDGTFMRSDYTYDRPRFLRILEKMQAAGCLFVVASGNQYWQLRDLFEDEEDRLCYAAENGGLVMDQGQEVFAAQIPPETVRQALDLCDALPGLQNILCGRNSAYCQQGAVSQAFFDLSARYYHRLQWVPNLKQVPDRILKLAPTVPAERTQEYASWLNRQLEGRLVTVVSGHDSIDLIVPGCHKASGLLRLMERHGITPGQCAAFGDAANDIEMLRLCAHSYAMANGTPEVKAAARHVCPANDEDGVLEVLETLFGAGS